MIITQSTPFNDLPDVLTVDEAAAFLRLGRSAMYEAVRRGDIQTYRVGRRILVFKKWLDPDVLASTKQ